MFISQAFVKSLGMGFSDTEKEAIEAAIANSRKRTTVDGTTQERHSMSDLIEARKFMDESEIAESDEVFSGIQTGRMTPPGTTT